MVTKEVEMTVGIDAVDVALAIARKRGTLTLEKFTTRFDTEAGWSVSDDHGVLFVEPEKLAAVRRAFPVKGAGAGSFGRLKKQFMERA